MYEEHPICRLSKKYGKPKYPQMIEAEKCKSFHINEDFYRMDGFDIFEVKISPLDRVEDYNVIVAGSSSFCDYGMFKEKCDYYLSEKMKSNNVVILSGTSNRTQEMTRRYCVEKGIISEPFRADWHIYDKDAHRICSAKMLEKANATIAFWDGKSTYTKMLIDMAKEKRIRIVIISVEPTKIIESTEYYE